MDIQRVYIPHRYYCAAFEISLLGKQNLAHICTMCAKIRRNVTYRSYFITRFQLLVQTTSFRDNTDSCTFTVISNEATVIIHQLL